MEMVIQPSEWEPAAWPVRPHPLRRRSWAQTDIVTLSLGTLSNKRPRELDQVPTEQACHAPSPNPIAWCGYPAAQTQNPSLESLFGQDPGDGKQHSPFPQKGIRLLGAGQKTQIGRTSKETLSPPLQSVPVLDTHS